MLKTNSVEQAHGRLLRLERHNTHFDGDRPDNLVRPLKAGRIAGQAECEPGAFDVAPTATAGPVILSQRPRPREFPAYARMTDSTKVLVADRQFPGLLARGARAPDFSDSKPMTRVASRDVFTAQCPQCGRLPGFKLIEAKKRTYQIRCECGAETHLAPLRQRLEALEKNGSTAHPHMEASA